jgi:tetratricopeptide (TPR) repeat protein
MSKYCGYCGAELDETAKFCIACGKSTETPDEQSRTALAQTTAPSLQQPTPSAPELMEKPRKKLPLSAIIGIIAGVIALTAVMSAFISLGNRQTAPLTAAELFDLGEKYLLELDYEQAIVQFAKLIEVEPKNTRAYIGLAEAYTALGRTDEAIEILQQGLAQLPDSVELQAMLDRLRPPEPTATPEPESEAETKADYAVEWVDPAFETMIRRGLNKPVGTIMCSELDFVTELFICGNTYIDFNDMMKDNDVRLSDDRYEINGIKYDEVGSIRRLDDVRNFRHLTELCLTWNTISNVDSLAEETNLTSLLLFWNEISNIDSLAKLTNLTRLYLNGNQIGDITPLAGLTKLTELDLVGNKITDVSSLAGLTNLTYLGLYDNPIIDWSPVAHIENADGCP